MAAPTAHAVLIALLGLLTAGGTAARAETEAQTVAEAYPPPAGAVRVAPPDTDAAAFGAFLGALPLLAPDRPVRTWDGRVVSSERPPATARVVDFPVVDRDLQQCADTAIRLRAEWQRRTGRTVDFHATSGDPVPWSRWARGERPRAVGNALQWSAGASPLPADPAAASEAAWERYLQAVFTWAGTASLAAHDTVAVDQPLPGDVVVAPGFPGHAVVLLDVAVGPDADGRETTWVLVGEGFMPAQDLHVQHGPAGGWWRWDPVAGLALPYWPLPAEGLRRWAR